MDPFNSSRLMRRRGDLNDVGKLVAEFSATAAKLSPAARKRLIARKAQFKELIA